MKKIDIDNLDKRLVQKYIKEGKLGKENLSFLSSLPDEVEKIQESELDKNYEEEIISISKQDKPWLKRK